MIKKYIVGVLRKCIKFLDGNSKDVDYPDLPSDKELEDPTTKLRYLLGYRDDYRDNVCRDIGDAHIIISFNDVFSKPTNYKF